MGHVAVCLLVTIVATHNVLATFGSHPIGEISTVALDHNKELVFVPRESQEEYELKQFLEEDHAGHWFLAPLADLAQELPKTLMEIPWGEHILVSVLGF